MVTSSQTLKLYIFQEPQAAYRSSLGDPPRRKDAGFTLCASLRMILLTDPVALNQ